MGSHIVFELACLAVVVLLEEIILSDGPLQVVHILISFHKGLPL
jgi:hypothetical protein